MIEVEKGEK